MKRFRFGNAVPGSERRANAWKGLFRKEIGVMLRTVSRKEQQRMKKLRS